jgi:tRNA A37 methylthiotransferase MiaB
MSTFHIEQFGCRATQADGAALERQLLDRGFTPSRGSSTADIVVINTCTVTAAADAQARDSIRKLHTANPAARVIVTGCYAQRAPEELAALPGVTWVVGNSHKPQIPNLVGTLFATRPPATPPDFVPATMLSSASAVASDSDVGAQHAAPLFSKMDRYGKVPPIPTGNDSPQRAEILIGDIFEYHSLLAAPVLGGEGNHTRPTLKIQDGCNLRCAYCVIPFVRGKSRSLPPETVIAEILRLTVNQQTVNQPTVEQPILAVLPLSTNAQGSSAATVEQPILAVLSTSNHAQESSPATVAHAPLPFPPTTSSSASSAGQAFPPVRLSPNQATISSDVPPNPNFPPAREIVLSGINLATYGRDLSPRVEFEDLLRRILDETPLERLRISSIEPQDVTCDLVELFASTDRLAQHFHMPLQSGSDRTLAAMHRWYRTEHYARRVELIHERLPHAAIGADVITGFPGETKDDHAATLDFIERLPFTYLHVFSFSQRPGTKAASLPNQVPGATIKRRARQLRSLADRKSAAFRTSQLGRTLRVLTLRREPDLLGSTPALSTNYLKFSVPGNHPPNHWLDVEIVGEGNFASVVCQDALVSSFTVQP